MPVVCDFRNSAGDRRLDDGFCANAIVGQGRGAQDATTRPQEIGTPFAGTSMSTIYQWVRDQPDRRWRLRQTRPAELGGT